MNKLSSRIHEYIESCQENTIIEIGFLYSEKFSGESEYAFAKAVERITKSGHLVQITRGMYYKPRYTHYGAVPITDSAIADFYMRDGHGIAIGYKLYNEKGLTTQVGKYIDILSDSLRGERKQARNVKVTKSTVRLSPSNIPVVETMEILQNYRNIEDLNLKAFASYMENFAAIYSEKATHEVLHNRK